MKPMKKSIAILCLLTLPLSGCSSKQVSSTAPVQNKQQPKVEQRPEISFDEMIYERPDIKKFQRNASRIRDLLKLQSHAQEVMDLFDEMRAFQDEVKKMYSLSSLHHSLDYSDEFYSDELSFCYDTYLQVYDTINTIGKEILTSKCKQKALKSWNRYDISLYRNYEPVAEDARNMEKKEKEILLAYESVVNDTSQYTVTVDGTSYTAAELYQAYKNGILSADEIGKQLNELTRQENAVLGDYFVQLIPIRQALAKEYGYDTYSDYCYEYKYNREYSTADIQPFYRQVKEELLPIYKELKEELKSSSNDLLQLNHTFAEMPNTKQLDLMKPYLDKITPSMSDAFDYMLRNNLYDLRYGKYKYSGGYTVLLSGYQEPFLMNQPEYSFFDFTSLIHEFGHFYSYYEHYMDGNDYSNLDLAEIPSQGLEILYTHYFDDICDDGIGEAASKYVLVSMLGNVIYGCLYDEFQQKVYQLQNPTLDSINQIFYTLSEEYGLITEDNKEIAAYEWIYCSHNYEYPLYYISYAVSAAPCLELWTISTSDFESACNIYEKIVAVGENASYSKTLEECGLSSPFSKNYWSLISQKFLQEYQSNSDTSKPAA